MEKNYKELIILIAEDDDGHAELIIDGLTESGVKNQMIRFSNGVEAWKFISNTGDAPGRSKNHTYLLLLDINMPKMDGIEVLRRMKSDEELKKTQTEWCFKKYSINNKIFVTINFKLPDSDKSFFIDENGEQIIFELGNEYDEFIVEKKYWYAT